MQKSNMGDKIWSWNFCRITDSENKIIWWWNVSTHRVSSILATLCWCPNQGRAVLELFICEVAGEMYSLFVMIIHTLINPFISNFYCISQRYPSWGILAVICKYLTVGQDKWPRNTFVGLILLFLNQTTFGEVTTEYSRRLPDNKFHLH